MVPNLSLGILIKSILIKKKVCNPFYKDVSVDNKWEDVREHSDPELWKILTDENAAIQKNDD